MHPRPPEALSCRMVTKARKAIRRGHVSTQAFSRSGVGLQMATSNVPEYRRLPKKEHDLFRSVVKFYETKQYKKGLKAADSVLKKFPNHGETLAMKGLTLNCLERKEEAYDYCRRGLKNDLRSHVCWHVFGLLHRSDRNYAEAIKCYLNALRIDNDNLQILRDLSLLQIQMRDLPGFVETRRKLVTLKSANRLNWIAYAVGNHLEGSHNNAVRVIDSYLSTQQESRERSYEEGELVLYRNMILQEAGKLTEALEHLDAEDKYVVDRQALRATRAELLLRLERYDEAKEGYLSMVKENSEGYPLHAGLQCAVLRLPSAEAVPLLHSKGCDLPSTKLHLTDAQRETLLSLYDELLQSDPSSLAFNRIPLGFLRGAAFTARVDAYMRKQINRGLPSLGSDLQSLFTVRCPETGVLVQAKDPYDVAQHEHFKAISALVDTYVSSLTANSTFPPVSATNGSAAVSPSGVEPTCLLWALYLKAQLLECSGQLQAALATIEQCLAHTPTAIDMLQRKARLLRKCGCVLEASDVMDAARQLDLADRYINNKTTKYLLRADRVDEAQNVIALFAKHEGDPQYNLFEMQCMWYELEWAASMLRQRKYGPALKKFAAVEKHFADFAEDQFDFHTYCIRKTTLRAYVDILRMAEGMLAHDYYQRAARGAVECYLALLTHPKEEADGNEPDYSGLTAAQKKREKAKARKAAKKAEAEKEEDEQAGAQDAQEEEGDDKGGAAKKKKPVTVPVDDDPHGEKLASKDPLVEAARIVSTQIRHAPKQLASHTLAYDVAMKRGKYLLALQALLRGRKLRPTDPEVVIRIAAFFHTMASDKTLTVHPTVAQVISAERPVLLDNKSLDAYVSSFIATATSLSSLPHRIAAARILSLTQPSRKAEACALILDGMKGGRGLVLKNCIEALRVVEDELQDAAAAKSLRATCTSLFPLATAFQGAKEGGSA